MPEFLVGELVRQRMGALSASERRLAQVLLAFYPVAGLESLTRFAERAGVSPATVTRFIAKLGLRGYPEFQDSLRQELQERLSSPLARYELTTPGDSSRSMLHDAFATYEHSLRASVDMVSEHDFDAVVELLADSRRRVLSLGGRVSTFLARYLASQLHLIRPGVELIDPERSNPADHLVDLGRRDVLVVFDYRRYQSDTINSAKVAAGRGSTVVLVTDPWLSPAAASARFVLVTGVQTTVTPFDTLVSAVALTEALIAGVLARLGETAHARMGPWTNSAVVSSTATVPDRATFARLSEDVAEPDSMIAERLELADWRRQVSELYAAIRAEQDPLAAWLRWREVRDRLFRSHPQSPVPAAERGDATSPAYYDYDPALRTAADLEAADGATFELPGSTSGHVTAERAGTAHFALGGVPLTLSIFWLLDYAGGFFLSFRDATSGDESYGAGRYVLDTAKGADLGAGGDGRLVLDFNFSYQPSCSYDPQWSCPLPPRENWLTIPIRAGERLRG